MEINSRRGNRERADLKKVIADELTISGSVERFFAEDKSTRLETTIPFLSCLCGSELLAVSHGPECLFLSCLCGSERI